MKKIVIMTLVLMSVNAVRANEVHKDKSQEKVACAKKCYNSIRNLWLSGTITLEEAQKLWQEHKKK